MITKMKRADATRQTFKHGMGMLVRLGRAGSSREETGGYGS